MAKVKNITNDALTLFSVDAPPIDPGDTVEVRDELFVERAWPTSVWEVVEEPQLEGYAQAAVDDAHLWAEPEVLPFDPGGATAAEVVDYLASADAAERARVIQAEAAGKARKTITEWSE